MFKQDALVFIGLLITSAIGAYLSKGIKTNIFPWYYAIIGMTLSYGLWLSMVKFYSRPLILSSMIYDVGTVIFWFLAFVVMGEEAKLINFIGMVVVAIGIVMIGL